VVGTAYSPEESERVRKVLRELIDDMGVSQAAHVFEMRPVALVSLTNGAQPLTIELVQSVAELRNVSVDQLLGRVRVASPAVAPAASVVNARDEKPVPAGPGLPAEPPLMSAKVAEVVATAPAVPATQGALPVNVPLPIAPPSPSAVQPPTDVRPAKESTSSTSADAEAASTLSIYEYASLSMGLELLPHRVEDVYAYFGLQSPAARSREADHWEAHLQASPKDRREWQVMRERMRTHWLRFDGQIVAAPAASPAAKAAESVVPVTVPPPIALEAYAALCVELHRAPDIAETTFAFYGLNDAAAREQVSRYWTERLATYPHERAEWERHYRAKAQELEARASHAPAAPVARQYVAAVRPMVADPTPTMSLQVYALLCVELEKRPKEREKTYKRHGLSDPEKRRLVEEGWRARLEQDPAERAKWQQLTDDIRADWIL
jgi:hypothetical protein